MHNRPTDTCSILLGAAEIIRQNGWVQRRYTDGRGYCLLGAIKEHMKSVGLADRWTWDTSVEDVLRDKINELYGIDDHPACWNDAYCTSREQAIFVLESAAGVVSLPIYY